MIAKTKTTAVPLTGSTAAIQPEVAMRNFVAFAKAWRGATISMVCAATNYLLVSCYLVADEKSRLTVNDAMDEMRKQIKAAAGIKGDMLGLYVTRAKALYQVLTEGNKYPAIVQDIAKFPNTVEGTEKATAHLAGYLETNWNVASLRALSAFLGYRLPVARQQPGGDANKSPSQQVANTVVNAIKAATAKATANKVPASVEAKAIANTVPDPLLLAREAIRRYAATDKADPSDLLDLIKTIEAMVDDITKRVIANAATVEADRVAAHTAKPRNKAKAGRETRTTQS